MKTLLLAALVFTTSMITDLSAEDTKLYEMRIYHANPGKLDALHSRFRDHTCALFEKHGMTQLGYYVPIENEDNILVYWLSYSDEDARNKAWKAFRDDPKWKAAYAASTKDGKLIEKVDSIFLRATDYSPEIEMLINKDDNRLFEWRTYTTNEGKLANLHARFRDHTCALFKKHGMTNLAYWGYNKGTDGDTTTLTYIIAHKDQETRDASFDGFRKDPDWHAARDASEKDGKILIKGGVKTTFLKPTDYTPTKD